ncbi:MAG: phage portal protein [Spirochaetes bacterium]|nr:phage portal protein [Spirochaetota bacterium]
MTILDKVFPKTAARMRNESARIAATAIANSLKASEFGRSGSLYYGQKWEGGLASSAPSLMIDHSRMRRQARTIEQTSQQARAIINRDVDTVVDSGMVLAPEPKYETLGITAEEAERWAARTAEGFDLWAQSKTSSRSNSYNFYQGQRLMRRYRGRDNECFVRQYYSQGPGLISPLQFEILDPDQIRGEGYTLTSGNFAQDDGIERDSQGRESGYKIWHQVPGTLRFEAITIPRVGPKSGRVFMTHGFDPDFAGQTRGFSSLGISVQELENLLDFTSAQIKKAINQSNIFIVGESNNDNPVVNPFDSMGKAGPVPSEVFGSTPTVYPDGENPESLATYLNIPEAAVSSPGSVGIFNMPGRQSAKPFANTAPSDSYDKFVDAYFAYIAAAQGTSIEVVLMRFSNNYSASRATLILAWRIAVQRRYQLACDHLDPLYEAWISEEIAAGRISAPGWSDPRLRAAWLAHRWVGSSMPNIDPVQTVKATELAAKLGLTTLDDSSMEYNGSSGKSNRAKLAREYAELPKVPWEIAKPGAEENEPPAGEGQSDRDEKKKAGGNK